MLAEKTGGKVAGRKTGGLTEKKRLANTAKNPRTAKNVSKSFMSTAAKQTDAG